MAQSQMANPRTENISLLTSIAQAVPEQGILVKAFNTHYPSESCIALLVSLPISHPDWQNCPREQGEFDEIVLQVGNMCEPWFID
jgi:hypothetical protein